MEFEFTDLDLTAFGGASILAQTARRLGLFELLGTPVWLRADNAYYKGELARLCAERGWDFSISLTNDLWRGPVLEQLEVSDSAWTDIGMEEEATFATHRPRGGMRSSTTWRSGAGRRTASFCWCRATQ